MFDRENIGNGEREREKKKYVYVHVRACRYVVFTI